MIYNYLSQNIVVVNGGLSRERFPLPITKDFSTLSRIGIVN